jgi:hypothetical protein
MPVLTACSIRGPRVIPMLAVPSPLEHRLKDEREINAFLRSKRLITTLKHSNRQAIIIRTSCIDHSNLAGLSLKVC